MSQPPETGSADGNRLQRCIRDLAALNALPSMCLGRSPDEALDIVFDALPPALNGDFVYLALPGSPPKERALLGGVLLADDRLAEVRAALEAANREDTGVLVLSHVGKLWFYEAELQVGSGQGRLVLARVNPLDPETDRVLVRSAANLVSTALESANVLEAARRKDEFLAMLGHELRNPLAPIAMAVELLARHPAAERERLVIERHTRHLARLVDDLLDISRVTRGYVELRNEDVSLASVLERAVEMAAPLVARQQHALRVASAEDSTVRGDPVRLAQIFGNLLTNAAKFTPSRGKIEVLIERMPGRVRVLVRDNGCGIAREQQGSIFEPFVQAGGQRDALRGGLGLGLAIVHNLIERHGGSIAVQSDGAGRGATFAVELPTVARVEPVIVTPVAHSPTARSGVRVLVVDDNVDVAELLAEALQVEGFETAIAHDARGALERWQSFIPHAAVLDVGLPELDGYELAKALRAQHGPRATLIAATGYGQQKDRLRAADAGFDCHFVKPVSVHDLTRVLDERVVRSGERSTPPPTA